ncbi:MAG: TonB-dependent receptor, partial [Deltaproteobacteria bacterium]|nr:TonB-dependent receptor [Deltaproteobacteria bacterium]
PAGGPKLPAPITVEAQLTISEEGAVTDVEVTSPPGPLDALVREAARGFRFTPATYQGRPVAVRVGFTQTLTPPPPRAVLRGWLREKGTRAPVRGATVVVSGAGGEARLGASDEEGAFEVEAPPGPVSVVIETSSHLPFRQRERLTEDEALTVGYLLQRARYDTDDAVVIGKRHRAEVARTTLSGRELTQVPGTFGDPFRVVQALPGVTTPVSLLPLPVVRGSSPSSTGFMLDQARLPLLFHLLGGPSVVHPQLLEEIHFYPGGAPVAYGGYTGGVIDGETRAARPDERALDVDLNLTQAGLFARAPLPISDVRLTAAGRYGYPGLLLSLLSNELSLSYWDYQVRLDGGGARDGWSVFSFGARDTVSTYSSATQRLEPTLRYEFHRLDLRYLRAWGALRARAQVSLGRDETQLSVASPALSQDHVTPRLEGEWEASEALTLRLGLTGAARRATLGAASDNVTSRAASAAQSEALTPPGDTLSAGLYAEALWDVTDRLSLTPGVRVDGWSDDTAQHLTLDPRLNARLLVWREGGAGAPPDPAQPPPRELWLKAGLGRYHQPPRFLLPVPGLDQLPLRYGVLAATQSSVGVEWGLPGGLSLDLQGYYNDMDPVVFDLSVNAESLQQAPAVAPGVTDPARVGEELIDRLVTPQRGRSYGAEVMLRRRSSAGVYGWLSYTRSRSERLRGGAWAPFDFDRPHILNAVLGVPLGGGWELGGRLQHQSGAPVSTTFGYNEGRKQGFSRLDVRFDKRVAWRDWLLDYYVDIQNLLVLAEEVAPGQRLRFVLPTVGLRGTL